MKQIDKKRVENALRPEKEACSQRKANNYICVHERLFFFEIIRKMMRTKLVPCSALFLSEAFNNEFITGMDKTDNKKKRFIP